MPTDSQFDNLVVNILSDTQSDWPFDDTGAHTSGFLDFAKRHRLSPLLHESLKSSGSIGTWPTQIRNGLSESTRTESAFQLLRESYVERLVTRCKSAQLKPIFFKGFALSRSVYPKPQLRPSVDTDLIVRSADVNTITEVFESLGFETYAPYRGALHSNQIVFRRDINETNMEFDCHFAINNRPIFARLLTIEELRAKSRQDGRFLFPSLEHSLLLACIHRVAHNNTNDLLWLCDFSYIVGAMSESQKKAFLELCHRKSVRQICGASLSAAGTTLKNDELLSLAKALECNAQAVEPTAVYLRPSRTAVGDAFVRWNSLDSTEKKAKYVCELLFPSRSFLEWKYSDKKNFLLIRNALHLLKLLLRYVNTNDNRTPNGPGMSYETRQGPN